MVADPRLDPINPHEEVARLARIEEERVRRDPNSTDEEIAAAREARKSADVAALLKDKGLQRQIAEHERAQQTTETGQVDPSSQSSQSSQPNKTWIDVPYPQKDEAKVLGARWDRQEQSWCIPAGVDPAPFVRWTPAITPQARPKQPPATRPRQYLAVPYGERVAAKAAGAVEDLYPGHRRRQTPGGHPRRQPREQQGRGSCQDGRRQAAAADLRARRASREPQALYRLQRPGHPERARAGRYCAAGSVGG